MKDAAGRRKRFTTERTESTEKTLLLFSVNSVASVVNLLSMTERERLNGITKSIIGAAIQVHSALGPGLLESAYEACLAFELGRRQLRVEQQKPLPLIYEQVKLDCGYRIDLLVEGSVVVEIKSVDAVAPIHEAQVITYLKLSGMQARVVD
jgi:GxxExxY protein